MWDRGLSTQAITGSMECSWMIGADMYLDWTEVSVAKRTLDWPRRSVSVRFFDALGV